MADTQKKEALGNEHLDDFADQSNDSENNIIFIIDGDHIDRSYFKGYGQVFGFDDLLPRLEGQVVIFPTAHPESRRQAVAIKNRLAMIGIRAHLVDIDDLAGGYEYRDDGTFDSPYDYFEFHIHHSPDQADRDQIISHLIAALPLLSWFTPLPLTKSIDPLDYPLNDLPDELKAAILEIEHNVQSPIGIIAPSLLTALATAGQAHYNISRDAGGTIPISLYTLIIASSGERKTSTDNVTFQAIEEYERSEFDRLQPSIVSYQSKIDGWQAERDGVVSKIKSVVKELERNGYKAALEALDNDKPDKPTVPRILFSDFTSEKLAMMLKEYPTGAIKTSEAGIVFGGHALSSDKALSFFTLANRIWEGGSEHIDRKTTDSYLLADVRLSQSLQVQGAVLQEFLTKNGRLADSVGYLPRCLISNPTSTMGKRMYREPNNGAAVAVFNRRVTELLNRHLPIDGNGRLKPTTLEINPSAKEIWIEFYNEVELKLGNGGMYSDITGAASKIAENALRVAAVVFIFNNDVGMVDVPSMSAGIAIAKYHLREALRFFNELSLPAVVIDAVKLEAWLLDYCLTNNTDRVRKSHVMQHSTARTKSALEGAIAELELANRARLEKDGRHTDIVVNPTLLNSKNRNC